MHPIKIKQRKKWKQHITEHAYQVDALTDEACGYWVESLPQPFAIQFTVAEEDALTLATETGQAKHWLTFQRLRLQMYSYITSCFPIRMSIRLLQSASVT